MSMFRRKRSLEDFQAEIDSHLAHEADQVRDRGSCPDADAAARRAFGNVTAAQEAGYEHWHWIFLDRLARDLRQAVRQMRNRPGFSAVVILTLALGIGANSAIFSIVDAVLLRPLPYHDPNRLAMLFSGDPARELHEGRVSLLNFEDWKRQSRSFEDMTAFMGQTFLLGTNGPPERMRAARVPANFWTVLGVEPWLGRVFTSEEEKRGERVAVLSHQLWRQQFGGSRAAIGASLAMDGRTYQVIGVMPPSFQFPFSDTKVWEPMTAHPYWTARDRKSLGSLLVGAGQDQARRELGPCASGDGRDRPPLTSRVSGRPDTGEHCRSAAGPAGYRQVSLPTVAAVRLGVPDAAYREHQRGQSAAGARFGSGTRVRPAPRAGGGA